MNPLRKFFGLSRHDRIFLLEALCISLFVKVVVFAFPMRWYSLYLNSSRRMVQESTGEEELIKSLTRAVRRTGRHAPWKTKCLVDAITAKLLLRRHGIPSVLYLGVHKDKGEKLVAHAWLKCGDKFITGRKGYRKFIVVSSFT